MTFISFQAKPSEKDEKKKKNEKAADKNAPVAVTSEGSK